MTNKHRTLYANIFYANIYQAESSIGCGLERDRPRFHISEGGIVVVPRRDFDAAAPRLDSAHH